jgi:CheY-like chemotaxis protein
MFHAESVHDDSPLSVRRRVLVIDDNIDTANGLRLVLQQEGYEVSVAHDGGQGLDTARAFAPDIIVCDIGLPAIDGHKLARILRSDPAVDVRLVALTGYGSRDDVAKALAAGFDAHLTKPLIVDDLVRLLAKLTTSSRGA